MAENHLWEVEHPYHSEEGNYLVAPADTLEAIVKFPSWEEFHVFATNTEFQDPDYNLVYRWDWQTPDPELYEDEELPSDKLLLFVIQQRKAYNLSYEIDVRREDEPDIREWLTGRAKKIAAIWQPVLDRALADLQ